MLMVRQVRGHRTWRTFCRHLAGSVWGLLKNHIDEVFFGDVRGAAVVLNAHLGIDGNPYVLKSRPPSEMRRRPKLRGPLR